MTELRTLPTITFGDDGSPGAATAWEWLVAQRWTGWAVDVVSVTDPPPGIESLFTHEPLHDFMPDLPREVPAGCGLERIRYLTTAFDPRIVLADRRDCDLVVIGARGRGLLKALHIGSTAEWLITCPTAPTIIARRGAPVHSVLACVDGSRDSNAMVAVLAKLPWIADTTVTLLAVREAEGDLLEETRPAALELTAAGAAVETVIIEPNPEALVVNVRGSILDQIEAREPDLVALGTAGRSGMERFRMGSVAGTIAHHASCSILLARA